MWYVYAWRSGPQVFRSEGPVKPKLPPSALSAIAAAQEKRAAPDTTSLRSLIRAWRSLDPARPSSPEWERLAPTTKKVWGSALDRIEEKWGDVPLALFNDPRMKAKIVDWRDSRSATPRAADMGITVLHALLRFGGLRGRLLTNIAADIPNIYRGADRAEIIWTSDDIARFTATARSLNQAPVIDALNLAVLTGFRREDLVTLTWRQVDQLHIVKRALKRSKGQRRFASIPRLPELDGLLMELQSRSRLPGVENVLVDANGAAWTPDRLTKAFNRVRDEAAIMHLDPETGEARRKHLHDARGTFATKLMTGGDLTDQQIAEMMGWSPLNVSRIRRVYVDQQAVVVAVGQRLRRLV